jgi:hypothetical protein
VLVLLRDRKRSQRGSVLSGVLIMVLFLAIISGALMTELSTQFLVSRTLVNRVGNEATVNSAIELALDRMQNVPLVNGCPALSSVTLNGRTAAISYMSCAPVVDVRSPQFINIATSTPFTIDGTHSFLPLSGQDLYLVGDSGGTIYQYPFGASWTNWEMDLGTRITGPPLAMQDAGASPPDPTDISNLVPIAGGGSSGCSANACVELLAQDINRFPDVFCYMAASGPVTSRPAAGIAFPQNAYFGDSTGALFAYVATEAGNCARQATATTPGNAAIVAGPIVFQNVNRDEVYVITSQGSTSQLLRYTYRAGSLTLADTLALPFANPVGLAIEKSSVAARMAITFAGGGVTIASINSSYDPGLVSNATLGTGIPDAPFWCACPSGPQIGVAGLNGTLYVLDTNLNVVASYTGGSPVRTSPASDGVGEWFFGADDGYLYEVQQIPGQPVLAQVDRYGPFGGRVASSALVGGCPAGICLYMGDMNSSAYLVQLDARDATITACLSDTPPACSGVNPRLWTQVEQGSADGPNTVHIRGWSYYSP